MNQLRGLAGFVLLMVPPWTPLFYVRQFNLQNLPIDDAPQILILFALALVLSWFGAVCFVRFRDRSLSFRFKAIGHANAGLCVLYVFIFSLLLYSRSAGFGHCQLGTQCQTLPIIWLTLAWMHFCYAVASYVIDFKISSEGYEQ